MQPRASVEVEDRSAAFAKVAIENLKQALSAMADSVLLDAQNLAPVLSGDLKRSGRKTTQGNAFIVEFGDSKDVPYARRRHYENKKNPQTLLYLQRAGEGVAKRGIRPYL